MRLKDWRARAKLTQEAVAARLGVTQVHYCNVENGRDGPGGKLAARIVRLTKGKVTLDDLYPPEDDPTIEQPGADAKEAA